jgi:threonine dehydrogenase-like Zn-dependent dehydrogenase
MTRKKRPETIDAFAQWHAAQVFAFDEGGVSVDAVAIIVSFRKSGETELVCETIGNAHAIEKAIEIVADEGAGSDPEPVGEKPDQADED